MRGGSLFLDISHIVPSRLNWMGLRPSPLRLGHIHAVILPLGGTIRFSITVYGWTPPMTSCGVRLIACADTKKPPELCSGGLLLNGDSRFRGNDNHAVSIAITVY